MTELRALLCGVVVTWARFLLTSHLGCCSQKKKTANHPWIQILETLNKIYSFLFSPGVGAGSQGVCSVTRWWLIRANSKDTPSLLASLPSVLSLPHLLPLFSPSLLPFLPSLPPTCSSDWLQTRLSQPWVWRLLVWATTPSSFFCSLQGGAFPHLAPLLIRVFPDGLF